MYTANTTTFKRKPLIYLRYECSTLVISEYQIQSRPYVSVISDFISISLYARLFSNEGRYTLTNAHAMKLTSISAQWMEIEYETKTARNISINCSDVV